MVDKRKEIIKALENKGGEEIMQKYEELANIIIDYVCDIVKEQHPEINLNTEIAKESGIENPAIICGEGYYTLEQEIARIIKKFVDKNI